MIRKSNDIKSMHNMIFNLKAEFFQEALKSIYCRFALSLFAYDTITNVLL